MPVVSVTRLHVRSWKHVPQVFIATLRTAVQARGAQGNLAVSLLSDTFDTYWTCAAWQDEASMKAFVHTGTHREMMGRVMTWSDTSSVVHWAQPSSELPSWPQAHLRLSEDGRHFPPPGPGEVRRFAVPRHRRWRELQFR